MNKQFGDIKGTTVADMVSFIDLVLKPETLRGTPNDAQRRPEEWNKVFLDVDMGSVCYHFKLFKGKICVIVDLMRIRPPYHTRALM